MIRFHSDVSFVVWLGTGYPDCRFHGFFPVAPGDSSKIPLSRPTLLLATLLCHNYISVSHPDLQRQLRHKITD